VVLENLEVLADGNYTSFMILSPDAHFLHDTARHIDPVILLREE
jgi:hypothetical protein